MKAILAPALLLAAAAATSASGGPRLYEQSKQISAPSAGNVSLVRIPIVRRQGTPRRARPQVLVAVQHAGASGLAVVSAVVADSRRPGSFAALVGLLRSPSQATATSQSPTITASVSAGFTLGSASTAGDVLYENPLPRFAVEVPVSARFAAGTPPGKADPLRLLKAARLLALERPANIADMELLGLQYVSVRLQRLPSAPARYSASVALTGISQVDAIELTFPVAVERVVTSPVGMQGLPMGPKLQLVDTQGAFAEATPYSFVFDLKAPPRRGAAFHVRASTHYFESALPFHERFFFP